MSALIEKILGVNWRTTAAALAAAAVVLAELAKMVDGDEKTVANWEVITAQVAIVWGFINARDAKVTSEKSSAK